jgi:TonB family protein
MRREIEPGLMAQATRTVWIAQSNDLILRDTWEFETDSASSLALGKSRVTTDYTLIEWGMPLAGDLFVFHPPEGSRAVAAMAPRTATMQVPYPGARNFSAIARKAPPEYSAEARAAGLQGTVSLYVEVDGSGKPSEVEVMEGLGLGLDAEAVKAVEHWVFKSKSGAADGIQDALEIDIPFQLDPPGPWHVKSESYRVTIPDRERHGDIVRPVPTHYVAPDAAVCREAGAIAVRVTVGTDGVPYGVRPVEGGASVLGDAAAKAVESWRFDPASGDGKKREADGAIEFECRPGNVAEKRPDVPAQRYRVGGGVSAPALLSKLEPEYSERAREAKVQGTSMLYVEISPEGKATHIHVVRRIGMGLDEKAVEAVRHWRFKPGMKDGTPVTVEATIEVNFRLK